MIEKKQELLKTRQIISTLIDWDEGFVREARLSIRRVSQIIENESAQIDQKCFDQVRVSLKNANSVSQHVQDNFTAEVNEIQLGDFKEKTDLEMLNIWYNYDGKERAKLIYLLDIVQYFAIAFEENNKNQDKEKEKLNWADNYFSKNKDLQIFFQMILVKRSKLCKVQPQFQLKTRENLNPEIKELQEKLKMEIKKADYEISILDDQEQILREEIEQLKRKESATIKQLKSKQLKK